MKHNSTRDINYVRSSRVKGKINMGKKKKKNPSKKTKKKQNNKKLTKKTKKKQNKKNKKNTIKKPPFMTLLYFYMEGCGYCKKFNPIWEELTNIIQDIKLKKINGPQNKALAQKYSIRGYPTIILIKGKYKIVYQGSRDIESIISFYNKIKSSKAVNTTVRSGKKVIVDIEKDDDDDSDDDDSDDDDDKSKAKKNKSKAKKNKNKAKKNKNKAKKKKSKKKKDEDEDEDEDTDSDSDDDENEKKGTDPNIFTKLVIPAVSGTATGVGIGTGTALYNQGPEEVDCLEAICGEDLKLKEPIGKYPAGSTPDEERAICCENKDDDEGNTGTRVDRTDCAPSDCDGEGQKLYHNAHGFPGSYPDGATETEIIDECCGDGSGYKECSDWAKEGEGCDEGKVLLMGTYSDYADAEDGSDNSLPPEEQCCTNNDDDLINCSDAPRGGGSTWNEDVCEDDQSFITDFQIPTWGPADDEEFVKSYCCVDENDIDNDDDETIDHNDVEQEEVQGQGYIYHNDLFDNI